MTGRARIFVVEDEALIVMEISARLTALGYSVCGRAASAPAAIAKIPAEKPDLVLMDVNLDGPMDGTEAAKRLRELIDVPVVFLTAYSDDSVIQRATDASPFGYLVKPFEERELHATIQSALSNHRLELRLREINKALADSERFALDVIDALDARIMVLDRNGAVVATNAAWRRFAAICGDPWHRVAVAENYLSACHVAATAGNEDAAEVARGVASMLSGDGVEFAHEYRSECPGRPFTWFQCRATRLAGSDSRSKVVLAHEDITHARAALEDLAASEQLFASLARSSPVGIFRADTNGNWEYGNGRLGDMAGVPVAELLGRGWTRFLHPEDRDRVVRELLEAAAYRPLATEFRILGADGSTRWILAQVVEVASADGALAGFVGSLTDITERNRIEETMHFMATGLVGLDGQRYLDAVALRAADMLAMDAAFVSRFDPAHAGQLQALAMVVDGALTGTVDYAAAGTPCGDVTPERAVIVTHDVAKLYPTDRFLADNGFEAYAAVPLLDSSGRMLGTLGVLNRRPIQDAESLVTILRLFAAGAADSIVRERSRRQYQDLWEFSPEGLLIVDGDGRIAMANRRIEQIFGWTAGELVGQPVELLVPLNGRANHERLRQGFARDPARRQMGPGRVGLQGLRKDGTQFPAEIELAPVQFEDRPVIAAAVRDVTARKALEGQLAQAMKMDAIGRLTGGMAHDFNNYLGVIMGNIELLKDRKSLAPDAAELADDALRGAARAAELTRSLLAFSRQQPIDPQAVDVNVRIADMAKLMSRLLGERIQVVVRTAEDVWPIRIDPSQFDTSLVNLATNARDAMPDGGTVTLATRNLVVLQDDQIAGIPPGSYVVVEVSDTGIGMTPDQVARAFEPFFTTKAPGHGTGLGLSTLYGFVLQSGGHVTLSSEPGRGTTVRLYLPPAGYAVKAAATVEAELPRGKSQTILVVEDNPELRRVAVRELTEMGYHVLAAENADVAWELLEGWERQIDLLFSDVVMPGTLDGQALAEAAAKRWPGIPILLASGFPGSAPVGPYGTLPRPWQLLAKPYRRSELARAIKDALELAAKPATALA